MTKAPDNENVTSSATLEKPVLAKPTYQVPVSDSLSHVAPLYQREVEERAADTTDPTTRMLWWDTEPSLTKPITTPNKTQHTIDLNETVDPVAAHIPVVKPIPEPVVPVPSFVSFTEMVSLSESLLETVVPSENVMVVAERTELPTATMDLPSTLLNFGYSDIYSGTTFGTTQTFPAPEVEEVWVRPSVFIEDHEPQKPVTLTFTTLRPQTAEPAPSSTSTEILNIFVKAASFYMLVVFALTVALMVHARI